LDKINGVCKVDEDALDEASSGIIASFPSYHKFLSSDSTSQLSSSLLSAMCRIFSFIGIVALVTSVAAFNAKVSVLSRDAKDLLQVGRFG
jgi:hypothetical protein